MNCEKPRCRWCSPSNPLYIRYHDEEWGVFRSDDAYLFEMLVLESFQAGLSWECILNKRENFRRAYAGFDLDAVCAFGEEDIARLLADPGIVRNRLKVNASIRNARIFRAIVQEYGSFWAYLNTFVHDRRLVEQQVTSPLSDAISADLVRRGMKFVGSTLIYSYLQAIGVIDSHEESCFLYPGRE
ncbi:MAG: DNA-3-methyladenine glycosylase I [Oscillospiraceae bacterium]|nr:DNA-3-methyladenine glycosylase I [Oscillospiraceae bacterium]